jgi:hypothetical protein
MSLPGEGPPQAGIDRKANWRPAADDLANSPHIGFGGGDMSMEAAT